MFCTIYYDSKTKRLSDNPPSMIKVSELYKNEIGISFILINISVMKLKNSKNNLVFSKKKASFTWNNF